MLTLPVKQLAHFRGLDLPIRATCQSAGADLRAALIETQKIILGPGERAAIPTGLAIVLPQGYEAQIRPRSGLAFKHGLTLLNAPGTIDADFRGEIKVLLINHGSQPIAIERGMRIAQLIIAPITYVSFELVETLPDTKRGADGFGSTGIS